MYFVFSGIQSKEGKRDSSISEHLTETAVDCCRNIIHKQLNTEQVGGQPTL